MRVWLRVMGALCLLAAAAAAPALVPYYRHLSKLLSADDLHSFLVSFLSGFLAPGVVAMLSLSVLLLATADGLRRLGEARRTVAGALCSGDVGLGSGSDRARTDGLREWLVGVGLLCFLPAVLVVVHTGLTRTMVERGAYTFLLAAISVALITLSCLSFAFARTLRECSLLGALLGSAGKETSGAGIEGKLDAPGVARWSVQDIVVTNCAAGMTTLCVVVAPVAGYSLVAATYLYAAFPRWSLVAFALGASFTFALVALASVSWATVRLLWLMHKAAEATPIAPLKERTSAISVSLSVVSGICVLTALQLLRLVPDAFNETISLGGPDLMFVSVWVIMFLTLAALTVAVGRSRHWIALLAVGAKEAPSPRGEDGTETEEGEGRETGTLAAPAVGPETPSSRPSSRTWRRRLVVGLGVMIVLAAALGGSARGFARTGPFLGAAYNAKGAHEDSLTAWAWVARLSPEDSQAQAGRGVALEHLGRWDEALAAFDRAIAIDPEEAGYYYERGVVLIQLGRYDEAVAAFDETVAVDPHHAWAYYGRAWVHALQGRRDAARDDLNAAIELEPALREEARRDKVLAGLDEGI